MRVPNMLTLALAVIVALGASASAEETVELPSYMLMLDTVISRDVDAPDRIFYAYNPDPMAKQLAEFDVEYPDNHLFPQGALFVLAVTDHTGQRFDSMSALRSEHRLIVDLKPDEEAHKPEETDEGRKYSRLLLIGCPRIVDIDQWAVRTADGKQHRVEAQQLKQNSEHADDSE